MTTTSNTRAAVPATSGADIADWRPEDETFWETTGKKIAYRNLWISIPALLCGFAVWGMWGIITVQMLNLGFPFTQAELFTLTAIAGIAGATMRIPASFLIRLAGGRNVIFLTTAMLLAPAIELAEGGGKRLVGRQIQGSVETGRWYDIRVDYAPDRIVCTLDGKVMYDESFPVTNPIHWVAGRTSSRDVTLKLVNSGATAVAIEIDLPGIQVVDEVLVETLTDPDPWAENTLEKPNRVKPERSKHQVRGGVVRHRFPPHSLTVMRWKRAR